MKKHYIIAFFIIFKANTIWTMENKAEFEKCHCEQVMGQSIHSPTTAKKAKTYEEVTAELIPIRSNIFGRLMYDMVAEKKLTLGDLSKITTCILSGADVNYCDEEKITPLMKAAFNGHSIVVEKLLLQKISPLWIDQKDMYGRTALMYAAGKGHETIVNLLLQYGANKELQDKSGWTAYQFAQRRGYGSLADKLKIDQESDDRAELKEIVIQK